jgi:hypothetical protein
MRVRGLRNLMGADIIRSMWLHRAVSDRVDAIAVVLKSRLVPEGLYLLSLELVIELRDFA